MTAEERRRRPSEVLGYCLFDFANSSYTTLISTVAYSVYFRQVVAGSGGRGDLLWSLAQVAGHVLLVVGAPVLGAIADHAGRKRRFLALTAAQTVLACAALALVGPGDVALGIVLLVIGTVGFEGGYVFYNACLADIASPRDMGRISGLSWGVGFVGGLAALLCAAPWIARPLYDGSALDPRAVADYRVSFVIVAAFFAAFAIPALLLLPERAARPLPSLAAYVHTGFARVRDTLRHLQHYRDAARFVAAALFFYGGIETVIKFSAIYAAVSFGIEGQALVLLFVVTNLVAAPGTWLAGWAADRLGGRSTLALTLVGWVTLVLAAGLVRTATGFWIVACGIAIGMGSTQAVARSFLAQIAPRDREAEFFGFYTVCSKIGSIAALLVFGAIAVWTDSQRLAVLAVLPFFAASLVLLLAVDEGRARRAALLPPPA